MPLSSDPPHYRMRRHLDTPVPQCPLPAGTLRVPFTTEIAPACRDLMNRTYAYGYGDPMPFEQWYPALVADSEYEPDLVWVAAAGDDIVGFCQCWTNDYVKDLVVAREWRKRGLGSALLTSALAVFAQRGAPYVDLKTDADNFVAQMFYKTLGFEIVELLGGVPTRSP